jgi:hypothetical protein
MKIRASIDSIPSLATIHLNDLAVPEQASLAIAPDDASQWSTPKTALAERADG